MARNTITSRFKELRGEFSANTKKTFLRDIEGQIEDDSEIQEILEKPRKKQRYVAVTFDRKLNDNRFSYQYFDLLLVTLDMLSGGSGIYKPANQIRVLQWNASKGKLLRVLRYFARNNAQVRFRRVVILPFPIPPVGHRIDNSIHKK